MSPVLRLSALVVLALSVLLPQMVAAQEPMTDEAYQLNQKGIAAVERGEYERAIRLFSESVDVQPLNITLLNLGRAHARAGQCATARSTYDRVPDAPAVDTVPRDKILEALYNYRRELDEECEEQEAPDSTTKEPEVKAIEKPDPPPAQGPNILGLSLIGVGGAALVSFTVIELAVLPGKFSELDELQGGNQDAYGEQATKVRTLKGVNIALLATGVATAGLGLTLLLLDAPERHAALPAPYLSTHGGGLAWFVRF